MHNVQKYTINVSLIILSLKNDKWFKALTLLNKNSITEYMPVLVTDDAPQSKDVERAIELGACDYLLFPFEFVDIMGFRFRCFVKNFFNLKFAKHLHLKVNDIEECESILNKEILLKCKCYGDIEIL